MIGTTSSERKAELARACGADHVIIYTEETVADRVRELTDGRGADVVYDSVGKTTWEGSIDSLRRRGMLASFGQSSGPVPPFDPALLNTHGSLFLTRPSLAHYTLDRSELELRSGAILAAIASGQLDVRIGARFPLAEAAAAHRALEGRQTTGKVLLIP